MKMSFDWRRLFGSRNGEVQDEESNDGIVATTRIPRKEEMSVRLKEGFDNLSGLLGNINQRLESQDNRNGDLSEHVRDLPDLLRGVHQQIMNQQQTFSALRDTLIGVERAIDGQANALRELEGGFQDTLQRFQGSQDRALETFQTAQRDTLESFRRSQERQCRQFEEVLKQTQHSFTKLLLLFFGATMGAVLLAILFSRGPF